MATFGHSAETMPEKQLFIIKYLNQPFNHIYTGWVGVFNQHGAVVTSHNLIDYNIRFCRVGE